jgi:putative intracellular protease/amidase
MATNKILVIVGYRTGPWLGELTHFFDYVTDHGYAVGIASPSDGYVPYRREIWRMHRLGFEGRITLRFDRIPQPWLREPPNAGSGCELSRGLGLEAAGGRPLRG